MGGLDRSGAGISPFFQPTARSTPANFNADGGVARVHPTARRHGIITSRSFRGPDHPPRPPRGAPGNPARWVNGRLGPNARNAWPPRRPPGRCRPALAAGAEGLRRVPGRLQRRAGRNGAVVLTDTCQRQSRFGARRHRRACLDHRPGRLVLGDMGEIGGPRAVPRRVGGYAKSQGIDRFSPWATSLSRRPQLRRSCGRHFARRSRMLAAPPRTHPTATVLVRGRVS